MEPHALCPFAQERHDSCTKQDTNYHEAQSFIVLCPHGIEQKVSCQQLNQSGVDEDPS